MTKHYPGVKVFFTVILLFALVVSAEAANDKKEQLVADNVSSSNLEQNLQSQKTGYLRSILEDPEKRLEYVKGVYFSQKLEQTIVETGLNKSQPLLETLRSSRSRILLDALTEYEFQKINADLEALAREQYEAEPEVFWARKRIKIALIFVKKRDDPEHAMSVMENIKSQLDEDPDNDKLFYTLAETYSDDPNAYQGGAIRKWLIAPEDLSKSSPALQAAFELDRHKQMTEIVEDRLGYSIVRLLGVVPARRVGFEEAKREIKDYIKGQLENSKKAEVMDSLKAGDDFEFDDEAVKQKVSELLASRRSENKDD